MIDGGYSLRRLGADGLALARRLDAMFGTAFDEPDTYGGDPSGRLAERCDRWTTGSHE